MDNELKITVQIEGARARGKTLMALELLRAVQNAVNASGPTGAIFRQGLVSITINSNLPTDFDHEVYEGSWHYMSGLPHD